MYFGSIPLNSGPIPAGMGQFLRNPVESRLFQCHSSVFRFYSGGIQWNPAEWMHSCRNLWGIKKYRSPSTEAAIFLRNNLDLAPVESPNNPKTGCNKIRPAKTYQPWSRQMISSPDQAL